MAFVVHLQTVVTTTFGVVDDNGNVVKKVPLNVELNKIDEGAMKELLDVLVQGRKQVSEEVNLPTDTVLEKAP